MTISFSWSIPLNQCFFITANTYVRMHSKTNQYLCQFIYHSTLAMILMANANNKVQVHHSIIASCIQSSTKRCQQPRPRPVNERWQITPVVAFQTPTDHPLFQVSILTWLLFLLSSIYLLMVGCILASQSQDVSIRPSLRQSIRRSLTRWNFESCSWQESI